MKILFIAPYVPNLIRVRPYNLIRHLTGLGHKVTLLTLWGDEEERSSLEQIEPFAEEIIAVHIPRWRSLWNSFTALPSDTPLQAVYSWQPDMARHIISIASKGGCDVVHVEHLRGARYGMHMKSLIGNGTPVPVVWDSVDSISHLFRQAATQSRSLFGRSITRVELGRTARYESRLIERFDHVTVTSQNDKRAFLDLPGEKHAPISVIPNGVDMDYFRTDPKVHRIPGNIVVSGKMSYHANITMVLFLLQEVMPLVWEERPEATLTIAGKDPSRELMAYADHPRVEITGTVADLPPYLQRAQVTAAPIRYGAGIQNKVLEAMACGTPVVATPQAVSALNVRDGEEVAVAESPRAFASSLLSLMDNEDLARSIGEAGRCYVERHHTWQAVAAQFVDVYQSAMESIDNYSSFAVDR